MIAFAGVNVSIYLIVDRLNSHYRIATSVTRELLSDGLYPVVPLAFLCDPYMCICYVYYILYVLVLVAVVWCACGGG